jgi:hypothetical protein
MTRRTRLAALVLPALLLAFGPLPAQHIPSPFTSLPEKQGVSVYGGYLFTDPSVAVSKTERAEFGPRSAPLVGLDYSIRLSNALSFRTGAAFSPSQRRIYRAGVTSDTNTVSPVFSGNLADVPLLVADAGMRLNITGSRAYHGMAPWAAAGAGVVTWLKKTSAAEANVPSDERFNFGPSFALTLKIGNDWYPTRRLSVGVHATDYLWKVRVPQGFRLDTTVGTSEWTNNYGLSAGATVHF